LQLCEMLSLIKFQLNSSRLKLSYTTSLNSNLMLILVTGMSPSFKINYHIYNLHYLAQAIIPLFCQLRAKRDLHVRTV